MRRLSEKKLKLLQTIEHLITATGLPPTIQEIANELSITSPSVHEALCYLEKKKYISRIPRKARSIKILYKTPFKYKDALIRTTQYKQENIND